MHNAKIPVSAVCITALSNNTSAFKGLAEAYHLHDVVAQLPSDVVVVAASSAVAVTFQEMLITKAPGRPLPNITTQSAFLNTVAAQCFGEELALIDDTHAHVLFARALQQSNQRFRPSGISASRFIRWKQEQQTLDRVEYDYPVEDRPADLRDMDRVLEVWRKYEELKGASLDRGDVSLRLVDRLAQGTIEHIPRRLFVVGMHGLTETDKLFYHLLARNGCDVAIRFAAHLDVANRSHSSATWLQSHGWEVTTAVGDYSASSISIVKAINPRDEVRRTLAAIKLESNNGIQPHESCIVLPADGSYHELCRAEALHAGVQTRARMDQQLANAPNTVALHQLCEAITEGFTTESVAALGSTRLKSHIPHFAELCKAARTFRIRGGSGLSAWKDQLVQSRAQLQLAEASLDVIRARELVQKALESVAVIHELFLPSANQMRTDEFGEWLQHVVQLFDGELEPLQRTIATYQRYVPSDTLQTFAEHVRLWWLIVCSWPAQNNHDSTGGVSIGVAGSVRLARFKRVYVLGFVEGAYPDKKPDAIERTLLPDVSDGKPLEDLSDVLLCHQQSSQPNVVFTHPRTVDSNPTLPSRFVQHLKESWKTTTNDTIDLLFSNLERPLLLSTFDKAATQPSTTNIALHQQGLRVETLDAAAKRLVTTAVEKPLNPTGIDTATSCPYQYFTTTFLGFDQEDRLDEMLSGRERGTLMHTVVQRFYDQLQKQQCSYTIDEVSHERPLEGLLVELPETDHYAVQMLSEILAEERSKYPQGYLYDSVERWMFATTNEREGLLQRWVESQRADQSKTDFAPLAFEVEFKGTVCLVEGVPTDVSLRIDRIDARISEGVIEVRVVDYKSKKARFPTKPAVVRGEKSQMPLYALAAKQWLGQRNIQAEVVGWSYQSFGSSIKSTEDPYVRYDEDDGALHDAGIRLMGTIREIQSLSFPVRPTPTACNYCSYSELCRINHLGPSLEVQE